MAKPRRREKPTDICSIYMLTNIKTDELYYTGQTWYSLEYRFRCHATEARCGGNRKLAKTIREVGIENIIITKIDEAPTQSRADWLEDFYILGGNTIECGCNCKRGGSAGKHSEETKMLLREKRRGQKPRKKLSLSAKRKEAGTYKGSKNGSAKLNDQTAREIKEKLVECKLSKRAIAREYHVDPRVIYSIAMGKTWAHVIVPNVPKPKSRYNFGKSKLTYQNVLEIRKLRAEGKSMKIISERYPMMTKRNLYDIINKKIWNEETMNTKHYWSTKKKIV